MTSALLLRILKKLNLSEHEMPKDFEQWSGLLLRLDQGFSENEKLLEMANQSLEISQREMTAAIEAQTALSDQQLRDQKSQIDAILATIPCLVLWTDHEYKYMGSNQAYLDFVVNFGAVLHYRDGGTISDELLSELQKVPREPGAEIHSDFKFDFAGVEQVWRFAIRNNQEGIVMVGVDLTHDHQVQKEIEFQRGQAVGSSRLAALGEMAAGIAHEINNPLAVIMGSTENMIRILGKEEIDREALGKRIQKVSSMAARISRIVRGLRTFARDGEADPFSEVKLSTILDETLDLCREKLMNHGVEVVVGAYDQELTLECRATQIGQIMMNLLNNARDAVENVATKLIQIQVEDQGERVCISVTDSGPGIPAEIRAKILQPFFTTKEVGKGTGLGLSISKGLADSHSGSLVLNEKSERTEFQLILPKKQKAQGSGMFLAS